MKAVVTNGNMDIRYTDIAQPQVGNSQVLVRVCCTGICGSDIPRVLRAICPVYPTVLGHEFCGVIEQVGSEVKAVSIGDRVAGVPLVPCGECEDCKNGNYGQCKTFKFIGTKLNGAMAEYVAVNECNVYRLSENVTDQEGAMFEPTTVALHAILSMGFDPTKSLAIVGVGTIGLLALQCAKLMGASHVYALDIDDSKLKKAEILGASTCINTKDVDMQAQINHLTEGRGVSQVLECGGVEATIRLALQIAGTKAKIMLVGIPNDQVSLRPTDFDHISKKELCLKGSWMSYSKDFPGQEWKIADRFFNSGSLQIDSLIEQEISLNRVPELFEEINSGRRLSGKILVKLPSAQES